MAATVDAMRAMMTFCSCWISSFCSASVLSPPSAACDRAGFLGPLRLRPRGASSPSAPRAPARLAVFRGRSARPPAFFFGCRACVTTVSASPLGARGRPLLWGRRRWRGSGSRLGSPSMKRFATGTFGCALSFFSTADSCRALRDVIMAAQCGATPRLPPPGLRCG